mmetsp:Transcript_16017/g.17784  ORF Transcript_16017/g.17784 Transcript_16017/m.17784 type:complete len:514 (+) Transcript_16017:48-1589(+)
MRHTFALVLIASILYTNPVFTAILINEVHRVLSSTDQNAIELANTGPEVVNVGGWTLDIVLTTPVGTRLQPRITFPDITYYPSSLLVVTRKDVSVDCPMIELDITIEDFATTEGLEIMLRDDTGTQVDYALLGPFFGRFTDEAEWTGSGYNFPTATGAMRTTLTDNNDASDWGELTMKSLCMLNPGQPDFPPTASPTVAPTEPHPTTLPPTTLSPTILPTTLQPTTLSPTPTTTSPTLTPIDPSEAPTTVAPTEAPSEPTMIPTEAVSTPSLPPSNSTDEPTTIAPTTANPIPPTQQSQGSGPSELIIPASNAPSKPCPEPIHPKAICDNGVIVFPDPVTLANETVIVIGPVIFINNVTINTVTFEVDTTTNITMFKCPDVTDLSIRPTSFLPPFEGYNFWNWEEECDVTATAIPPDKCTELQLLQRSRNSMFYVLLTSTCKEGNHIILITTVVIIIVCVIVIAIIITVTASVPSIRRKIWSNRFAPSSAGVRATSNLDTAMIIVKRPPRGYK